MSSLPNVLHVSAFPFDLSGANRSMLTLVREMAERGDAFVFCPCDDVLTQQARELGAKTFYAFKKWPKSRLVRAPLTILKMLQVVRDNNIQIINSHSAIANHYCRYVKLLSGLPLITHQRDMYERNYFHSDLDAADRIIGISEFVRECLPENLQSKTFAMHNPVWIDEQQRNYKISKKSNLPVRIGMAGRCNEGKGQDIFLKAALPLIQSHGIEIEIWGVEGAFARVLEDIVNNAGSDLWQSVKFEPFRKDTDLFYKNIDIVVAPSIVPEGMGRIPIEAMSWHKPVIASNSGGMPELLRWADGLIFEKGDIDEIRSKLIRLIENPDLRKVLGHKGFAYVEENHSHIKYCDEMIRRYDELLSFKSQSASRARRSIS